MKISELRRTVCSLAHQIKDIYGNMSEAMTAAWKIAKPLYKIATDVEFTKADGTLRKARIVAIQSINVEKDLVRFWEEKAGGIHNEVQMRSLKFSRINTAA